MPRQQYAACKHSDNSNTAHKHYGPNGCLHAMVHNRLIWPWSWHIIIRIVIVHVAVILITCIHDFCIGVCRAGCWCLLRAERRYHGQWCRFRRLIGYWAVAWMTSRRVGLKQSRNQAWHICGIKTRSSWTGAWIIAGCVGRRSGSTHTWMIGGSVGRCGGTDAWMSGRWHGRSSRRLGIADINVLPLVGCRAAGGSCAASKHVNDASGGYHNDCRRDYGIAHRGSNGHDARFTTDHLNGGELRWAFGGGCSSDDENGIIALIVDGCHEQRAVNQLIAQKRPALRGDTSDGDALNGCQANAACCRICISSNHIQFISRRMMDASVATSCGVEGWRR
mmetsp:Transcript_915/g.1354  ORF Transcript_915/g.1354 Transcript_915/m.1354 type:complete len:335 (-) Transcript_915:691-1695(-)